MYKNSDYFESLPKKTVENTYIQYDRKCTTNKTNISKILFAKYLTNIEIN